MRGARNHTREVVLQSVHATEISPQQRLQKEFDYLMSIRRCGNRIDADFSRELLRAIGDFREQIVHVAAELTDREWSRVEVMRRSLIIQGASEMLGKLTAPRVAINEYVELAHRFGTKGAAPYTNAILDTIGRKCSLQDLAVRKRDR